VDLANLLGDARVKKDPLRGSGLASVYVSDDADVARVGYANLTSQFIPSKLYPSLMANFYSKNIYAKFHANLTGQSQLQTKFQVKLSPMTTPMPTPSQTQCQIKPIFGPPKPRTPKKGLQIVFQRAVFSIVKGLAAIGEPSANGWGRAPKRKGSERPYQR
jgi:hypothetical protein